MSILKMKYTLATFLQAGKCVWVKFQVLIVNHVFYFFVFWSDFGLSWLTSLQFIQYHVAGLNKPTIPQSSPSHLRDYSICKNARLEFSTIFVPRFDSNEWCLKNGLHSGGLLVMLVIFK
jgi:hypothetical protein